MLLTLTFALAYASTNLDNLALLLGLAPTVGVVRASAAFVLTQALVIAAAFAVGAAADALPAAWLGWLGLVPIGLGLRELWRTCRGAGPASAEAAPRPPSGWAALTLTFAGLSADTFALTAALLADSAEAYDLRVMWGAVFALACLCLIGIVASRAAAKVRRIVQKLERLTPFVMIASGLYILADTVTDLV